MSERFRSGAHRTTSERDEVLLEPTGSPAGMSAREISRALGGLYAAGSVLAIIWVTLPHAEHSGDGVVLAIAVIGLLFGTVMVLGVSADLPLNRIHLVIGLIQVAITIAYVAAGNPSNDIRLFYLWATPYAVFFFSTRAAALHSAWVVACMTTALLWMHPSAGFGLSVAVMTLGTVAAVWSAVAWATRAMRRGELRLRVAATHDALTGLPNRTLFLSRCSEALNRMQTSDGGNGRVIVLLVDLDRFKVVNDTFGHYAGDALLAAVAPRMRAAVRSTDTVARLGGDEFAVVIEDPRGNVDPAVVASHLAEALTAPVQTDQVVLYTSGGIGYAVSSEPADTAVSLLRDADAAMYRAKSVGPGSTAGFDAVMRNQAYAKSAMEKELRTALARSEFHLAYQPIIDLDDGRLLSAEALLRWDNPELGAVQPVDFVPVTEETGLIVEIGAWVISEAARQLSQWVDGGIVDETFAVAVNVSAVQLRRGLIQHLSNAVDLNGLRPEQLAVEITETALIRSLNSAVEVIGDLHDLGMLTVLDDFGTGFSSLSHLQRIPLDALKIDQSFVAGLADDEHDAAIITAIVNMAAAFDLDVIAEGVETEAQEHRLRALGCRRAQGYRYSHPVSGSAFELPLGAAKQAPRRRHDQPSAARADTAP